MDWPEIDCGVPTTLLHKLGEKSIDWRWHRERDGAEFQSHRAIFVDGDVRLLAS